MTRLLKHQNFPTIEFVFISDVHDGTIATFYGRYLIKYRKQVHNVEKIFEPYLQIVHLNTKAFLKGF